MMAKTNDGIIVPLFRKITQGFQKIFIPSDHIILEDNETTLQEKINEIDNKKKLHTTDVVVNVGVNVVWNAFQASWQYAGSPPVEPGYTAVRIGGYGNGQLLLCTADGRVMNPHNIAIKDVRSITWRWLMIPDE